MIATDKATIPPDLWFRAAVVLIEQQPNPDRRAELRELFEYRAAIAEYDGGLPREAAEVQALTDVIDEWLDRHRPTPSGSRHCAGCGGEIPRPGGDGVPHHVGDAGAVWLHHGCWDGWHARRREEARRALAELGVWETINSEEKGKHYG